MRTAAKKDTSHKEIEFVLNQLGIASLDCSQLKNAFDFMVFFRGETYLFEAKTRDYASKANQQPENRVNLLTAGERDCYDLIWSAGVAYHIVFDANEVLEIIGAI